MAVSSKKFSLWKILLLLILSAIVIFIFSFNLNHYKSKILVAVNKSAPVIIDFERIDYRLTSPSQFSLQNLQVQTEDKSLDFTLDRLDLSVDFNALLSKQVIIKSLVLGNAKLHLSQAGLQALTATSEKENEETSEQGPLPIQRIAISDFELKSFQLETDVPGKTVLIDSLAVKIFDAILIQNSQFLLEKVQLTSNVNVSGIKYDTIDAGKVNLDFHLNDGQLTINQLLADSAYAQADAQATVNLLDPNFASSLRLQSSSIHLAPIFTLIGKQSISATGDIALAGSFDLSPLKPTQQLISETTADISIESSKLTIEGIDLDNAIGSLQDSQNAGLLDIGGYMLTGPIGLVAGQMLDLGSGALNTNGGATLLSGLGIHSTLDKGIVTITDTAIATTKYRVSFDGGFDIPNLEFKDLTFNILDEKGCATLKQTLKGSVKNPKSAVTDTLLGSLVNPLLNFAKQAGKIVSDDCKPVYQGQVKHPTR